MEIEINRSDLKAYEGLIIKYLVHLQQTLDFVEGTVEKIEEQEKGNPIKTYVGVNRIHIKAKGAIFNNYLFKSTGSLLILENGSLRESSTFNELSIDRSNNIMKGIFTSSVSNSSGKVIWTRQ